MADSFKPALIVVDMQEDFCPPVSKPSSAFLQALAAAQPADTIAIQNGSLAVEGGRDIAPLINRLLDLPFVTRIATQDWHPEDHVSFAANHAGKQPFCDFVTVVNPQNASESYESRLWPVHCVQGSHGARIITELDVGKIDTVIRKGMHPQVEMYSAFYDPLLNPRISDSGLARMLKDAAVTHVYVVGLAADYCVKSTAMHAAKEGFTTYIIEEGTRPVDASAWPACKPVLERVGVRVVSVAGPELAMLRRENLGHGQ